MKRRCSEGLSSLATITIVDEVSHYQTRKNFFLYLRFIIAESWFPVLSGSNPIDHSGKILDKVGVSRR